MQNAGRDNGSRSAVLLGVDNRPCTFFQSNTDNRLAEHPQIFFSPGWGGGFRDKKNIFFENPIYLTKIPTKSIFNFGKRYYSAAASNPRNIAAIIPQMNPNRK
jgi:hypothetical protein